MTTYRKMCSICALTALVVSGGCNSGSDSPFGFDPHGIGASGSGGGSSAGRWSGTASCMRILGDDRNRYAVPTSVNVNSVSSSSVTLSDFRLGSFSGIECAPQTLTGVANGASASASGGFVINEFESTCSDDAVGYTGTGQGFIIGGKFHLTLFLSADLEAAQCFIDLDR